MIDVAVTISVTGAPLTMSWADTGTSAQEKAACVVACGSVCTGGAMKKPDARTWTEPLASTYWLVKVHEM
ncbi:MAG: hypothetical protein P4L83_10680, partial [Nevskia sp.]|nr:hypothetical protein [Nevskia sp.]